MQVSKINALNYMQKSNANNECRPRINSLSNNNQIVNNEVIISKSASKASAALNFTGKLRCRPIGQYIRENILPRREEILKAAAKALEDGTNILKRVEAGDKELEVLDLNIPTSKEIYVTAPDGCGYYFVNDKLENFSKINPLTDSLEGDCFTFSEDKLFIYTYYEPNLKDLSILKATAVFDSDGNISVVGY